MIVALWQILERGGFGGSEDVVWIFGKGEYESCQKQQSGSANESKVKVSQHSAIKQKEALKADLSRKTRQTKETGSVRRKTTPRENYTNRS